MLKYLNRSAVESILEKSEAILNYVNFKAIRILRELQSNVGLSNDLY